MDRAAMDLRNIFAGIMVLALTGCSGGIFSGREKDVESSQAPFPANNNKQPNGEEPPTIDNEVKKEKLPAAENQIEKKSDNLADNSRAKDEILTTTTTLPPPPPTTFPPPPPTQWQPPPTIPNTTQPYYPPPTLPNTTPGPGTQGSNGTISFPVAAASNMEGDFQFTTAGYRVFVTDQRGIVGAGIMTIHAVLNAQRMDMIKRLNMGGGFKPLPVIAMRTDLQYVRSDARGTQGQGKIFVCMAQDPRAPLEQSRCTRVRGGFGENWVDVQWDQGKDVTYVVDQTGNLKITGYGQGLSLTGSGLNGNLVPAASVMHPHEAPVAQVNAAGLLSDVDARSPIVLDLDKNGALDLVDVWSDAKPIHFDLTATGEAKRTGWVKPNDALLVLDVNGNGKIDSGRELFGQHSYVAFKRYHKQAGATPFAHGYDALAQYDLNHDDVIDSKDAIYKLLKVWQDNSQDGQSQAAELKTLAEAGVASLNVIGDHVGTNSAPVMNANNFVRLVSTYTAIDGKKYNTADVWFHVRDGLSVQNYLGSERK
jgi:hypothetical protein